MVRKLSAKDCIVIDQAAQAFVEEFKRKNSALLGRSPTMPAIVKRYLLKRIGAKFTVKRGPKPDPQIIRAHELLSSGLSKRQTLYLIFPGLKQLDSYGKRLITKSFNPKLKRYDESRPDGRKKPLKTRMSK